MFLTFCHLLNRIGLSWLAAALRVLCYVLLCPWRQVGLYTNPVAVGYRGWIRAPLVGPLVFLRLDGSRQYRW